ncbi:hypothetical protein L916_11752 [Phytophthora nicotianae]|uniref:Uncharacterized protein n=2 Tax=Phytophthora nicotianae TaxID=4792 RepID=W2IS92_PHYNI|nr:hypothetical protein L916_11752 [Phytophthora nicotianae]
MGYMCHDRDRSAVNQHYDEDYTADKPGSDTKLGDEGHQRKRRVKFFHYYSTESTRLAKTFKLHPLKYLCSFQRSKTLLYG